MIQEKLAAILSDAISCAQAAGQFGSGSWDLLSVPIVIGRPHLPDHGDLFCPVAMSLAAQIVPPGNALQLAWILVSHINAQSEHAGYFSRVEAVAPGFINFGMGPRLGTEILLEIGRLGEDYGRLSGQGDESAFTNHCLPESPQELSINVIGQAVTATDLDKGIAGMTGVTGVRALTGRPNAAFFVQYVYAWCSSMLRLATQPPINILSGQLEPPLMSPEQWETFLLECKIKVDMYLTLDLFQDGPDDVFMHLRQSQAALILKLDSFPEQVAAAGQIHQPERLSKYALELAHDLTKASRRFNLGEGLFCADLSVLKARLGLILVTRQVLANALGIIGVPVSERM